MSDQQDWALSDGNLGIPGPVPPSQPGRRQEAARCPAQHTVASARTGAMLVTFEVMSEVQIYAETGPSLLMEIPALK